MSAQVGDTVLVNVDPLQSGGATTAGAIVCRVMPADPEAEPDDVESHDRISAWVFADYTTGPVLRQDLVAVDVLPEPKKKSPDVRDLTVYAPRTAPVPDAVQEPAADPATAPVPDDQGTGPRV